MKKFLFYTCVATLGFFSSCSQGEQLDPSVPVNQDYGIFYDIMANTTRMSANFRKINAQGIPLRFGDGDVLFNNKQPEFTGQLPYMYLEQVDGLVPVTFTFIRYEDMTFVNSASISDVSPITIPDTLTSVSEYFSTIYWVGDPVGADEYVEAHLEYKGGTYTTNTSTQGARFINLNLNTSNVTAGQTVTLYITRVKKLALQDSQSTAGGQINVSYGTYKSVSVTAD